MQSQKQRCISTLKRPGCCRGFFFLVVCSFFLLALGCSYSQPSIYIRKDYDKSKISKVAVFPFFNHSNVVEASEIVTGAFIGSLVETRKFQVEFPGNVKSFLVSERIVVRTGVDLDTIKLMGKRLEVDAVFLGQIDEYVGAQEGRRSVVPLVSVSSRMVDSRTGKILFMAQQRKTGDDYITVLDFGKIRSVGELTKKVVGEIIDAL